MKSISDEIKLQINELLDCAALPKADIKISPFNLGGNNQTFRIETQSGTFVAKKYFSHSHDKRNRLDHEFSFLSFVQNITTRITPRAITKLDTHNIALYEFVQGSPFVAGEIGENEVNAAANFFCKINQEKHRQQATSIQRASEACFSLVEHISLIQKRIDQIREINRISIETKQAYEYGSILYNHLEKLKQFTLPSQLTINQYCISPSDFGFHNAIKKTGGEICFIDFEYAGWDDPAKMVADFFSQLAIPVPTHYFKSFTKKTMSCFPNAEDLIARAFFLRPIYHIKWCCIALNIFLPYHLERRMFANQNLDLVELQKNQLAKAKKILYLLEREYVQC